MNRITLFIAGLLASVSSGAQSFTYSNNIASVIYANCTYCHRQGSIAPAAYEFTSFKQVYAFRYNIKSYINSHIMPPWPPDPTYTRMAHERLLSQDQINMISKWVDDGAPRGDSSSEPVLPTYKTGSQLQSVDLSKTIPTYKVTSTTDVYRCFAMPSGLTTDKMMTALEFLPANGAAVHHILLYYDTTGTCLKLDKADPSPGYVGFGGVGTSSAILIGGWVPGSSVIVFPKGMGMTIPKGATLVMQIHYAPGSYGLKDSSSFNMQFSSSGGLREVYQEPALNHFYSMLNGPLEIPANSVKSFKEEVTIPFDVSMISIAPHMHLIGTKIKVYAVNFSGDTTPLININKWDFHWQGFYQPKKIVVLKAGTKVYAEATYDNTSNNPSNPNSPPKKVVAGESTTNEMMIVFFGYLYYQKGDENTVLDTAASVSTTGVEDNTPLQSNFKMLNIFPNPVSQLADANLNFALLMPSTVEVRLVNMLGQEVISRHYYLMDGNYNIPLPTGNLPAGSYICSVTSNGSSVAKHLIIGGR